MLISHKLLTTSLLILFYKSHVLWNNGTSFGVLQFWHELFIFCQKLCDFWQFRLCDFAGEQHQWTVLVNIRKAGDLALTVGGWAPNICIYQIYVHFNLENVSYLMHSFLWIVFWGKKKKIFWILPLSNELLTLSSVL